ncbi:SGNH/GDSL hydrolase family protein [Streptomyces sp. NPDC014734]|uniref:SGNH/GDSL hydrolase family protein n=1 Tax=Streptomyces sp. NPDC014734 TaxID=3364886 RepID=UPI0036FE665E
MGDHCPRLPGENKERKEMLPKGRLIAGGGTALALTLALSAPTAAAPENRAGVYDRIVLMGDSFISGEGGAWEGNAKNLGALKQYVPDPQDVEKTARNQLETYGRSLYTTDKKDPGCHRSDASGGFGLYDEDVENFACSGAESKDILTDSWKGEQPQIEQLKAFLDKDVNYKVTTLVISIGGNDLKLGDVVKDCVSDFVLRSFPCSISHTSDIDTRMEALPTSIGNVVDEVGKVFTEKGKAIPQIVLRSYPNPFSGSKERREGDSFDSGMREGIPFYNMDLDWLRDVNDDLNAVIKSVATTKKVGFLGLTDLFDGHEVGSNQAEQVSGGKKPAEKDAEWARSINAVRGAYADKFGRLSDRNAVQEYAHPNYYGQLAMNACLFSYMRFVKAGTGTPNARMNCEAAAGQSPENGPVTVPAS